MGQRGCRPDKQPRGSPARLNLMLNHAAFTVNPLSIKRAKKDEIEFMSTEGTQINRQFTLVMRGSSAVLFRQTAKLLVLNAPSSLGPVEILYQTRWLHKAEKVRIPGHLWIEIRGSGPVLEKVLVPFANAALATLPILSLSANAAIGEPDLELAFDSTPDVTDRDYFQSYIPAESELVQTGRHINIEATVALLGAIEVHPDGERLRRAANQYRLALNHWRLGRESLSLAHLWMATEALTTAKIRAECKAQGLDKDEDLARALNIEKRELDATVRKDLILKGDDECYKKSKEASDGFEHGFLGFDKIRELSRDVRHRMAEYVRTAILEMSSVDSDTLKVLTSDPFREPLGHWPVVRYLRGKLIGGNSELALHGEAYPFIKWSPVIRSTQVTEEGKLNILLDDNFTVVLGEGISFKAESYEAWAPG